MTSGAPATGSLPTTVEFPAGSGQGASTTEIGLEQSWAERFRIVGVLGRGGMGVVYRAEDSLLGRSVALKTIPAALTAGTRAKERFLREARAASALDHPNVCTIYEIEKNSSGQIYLCMPSYDGETLRSRLERGRLALPEALAIVKQVASGLAEAHRLGIIHCDIKPANLMLTGNGLVKILDFGIARLSSQTSSYQHDGPCGTPRYRSPEQERGDEVGTTTDIWSLGIVLYEMLTGPTAKSDGNSVSPAQLQNGEFARIRETSPELGRILARMLAPAPSDRYPDAVALLADLGPLPEDGRDVSLRRRTASARRRRAAAFWALVCLAVPSGYLTYKHRGLFLAGTPMPSAPLPANSSLATAPDSTARMWYPSLSPDGSFVVYAQPVGGRSHIFTQMVSPSALPIDLTADSGSDDTQPAVSPDGRTLAFRSERNGGGIFLMRADGGPARRLTNFGFNPAWSPDGKRVVCGTAAIATPQDMRAKSEVFIIDSATGARQKVTSGAAQPSWSPDGRWIAYFAFVPQTRHRAIWMIPAGGGEAIPVVDDSHVNWNPVWSPDGRYLYFVSDRTGRTNNIWRVSIDPVSGRARGRPEQVTSSRQPAMMPSFPRDGRQLVYAVDRFPAALEKISFDPVTGRASAPSVAVIGETSDGMIKECDGLIYELWAPQEKISIVQPDGDRSRSLANRRIHLGTLQFSPESEQMFFYTKRGDRQWPWKIELDGRAPAREGWLPGIVATPGWLPGRTPHACGVLGLDALIGLTTRLTERSHQLLQPHAGKTSFIAYAWSPDGELLGAERGTFTRGE